MRKVYLSFCVVLCAMLVLVALSGCQTPKTPKEDDQLSWAQEPAIPASNGAIYQVGRDVALFENPIARHVGDIVTIVLNESTAAKKSATTTTAKTTSDTLPGMTLFGSPVTIHGTPVLSSNINDASKFNGEGDSAVLRVEDERRTWKGEHVQSAAPACACTTGIKRHAESFSQVRTPSSGTSKRRVVTARRRLSLPLPPGSLLHRDYP